MPRCRPSALVLLLGAVLAAPVAAQAPAARAAPKKKAASPFAPVLEQRAVELLRAMSRRLAAAKRLSCTAVAAYEYPSRLGPPIVCSVRYDVALQRPAFARTGCTTRWWRRPERRPSHPPMTQPAAAAMASTPRACCVLLAQSHQRLSEGLRGLLQASFAEVFMVADRPSLVEGTGKLQPTLVVVDLGLAEGDLPVLLAELHRRAPRALTLLLSDYDDPAIDNAAAAAGADGIVHKSSLATDLVDAVDAVLAGRRFFAPPGAHRSPTNP